MNRLIYIIPLFILILVGTKKGQSQSVAQEKRASFEYFEYQGKDAFYQQKINHKTQYFNPILGGFYPDPSICRKGDDYYLVNSSFSYFPGIPIFHSKDLVNWKQIGYVLDRPSQLNLTGIRLSGGIYAPAITYNKNNDTFYLVTTCVDGIGNFVVKTKDPAQGWSDPVLLPKVGGIDPSLFFDDNGKAYLVHNDEPEGPPQWNGHRAIRMHEYDVATDQTGTSKIIIDGGVDKSTNPVWIEGPHIYKKDGYYYLMAAEGGTSENHSEVIFRSKDVWGEYIPAKNNPILTQRDLPENRQNKVTSTGHADIIEDANGSWWAVFLACRPYEKNYYNTGRETFLLPVKWESGFPVILPKGQPVPLVVNKKGLQPGGDLLSGNFVWQDNFDNAVLNLKWNFIRTPDNKFYQINNGKLELTLQNRSIKDICTPSFMGVRQQSLVFEATTQLKFVPGNENELAGVVCFQDERHNFILGKTIRNNQQVMVLEKTEGEIFQTITTIPIASQNLDKDVFLKVMGNEGRYSFYIAFEKNQWQAVAENVDATILSTAKAGGFVGTYLGMYATAAATWKPLKTAYQDYFPVGVAVSMFHLRGQQAALIKTHFNSITAENAMKPANLLVKEGGYRWEQADQIARFARMNRMKLRGHTLVWHSQTPAWFFLDENGKDLDTTRLYARMKTYMTDVMEHFHDVAYCWDVVNEALSDKEDEMYRSEKSGWYRICKEKFIEKAFRYAREINPNIKLFYNDYNLTDPAKREKAYEMLKSLLAKGVPIDGVGMQAHWSMQDITEKDIQTSIDRFSSLGLEVQFTELDLTLYPPYHGDGAKNQPTEVRPYTPELAHKQAELYRMIFEVFRKNKGKVTGVTLWGLADNYTWLDNFPVPRRKDHPLLFDEKMEPKEAFYDVVNF